MHQLILRLPSTLRHELDDLADATGRRPEDIALDAVAQRVAQEAAPVRGAAESLARAHADLLRRLGE
ncbi:hypothetical protein [Streptomyces sp. NPDC002779]|uniref:hypothetical protein n=1 Tax=Streptomyces sp. NPDC002779 TaxID=3364664 RepID=UPI0036A92ACD